jgi:predicted transcriptional regulator
MPTKAKSLIPTSTELRILNALWALREATVDQIVTSFPPRKRPNYKTTHTFLRIMEQKGFVKHTVDGRVFVFEPIVSKEAVNRQSVKALLSQNFGGSARGLFINLLESDAIAAADLDAIEDKIQEYRIKKKEESIDGRM